MEKELEVEEAISQEAQPDEQIVLEGDEAILLWLKGKGAWNEWMKKNPKASVSFDGVEFSYKALKELFIDNPNLKRLMTADLLNNGVVNFRGYNFSGEVEFYNATFSGVTYFNAATFSGNVDFTKATFIGRVYFNVATFSGVAYFNEATFSDGAHFYEAAFSSCAKFKRATFSGNITFNETTFSGNVFFEEAVFSDSIVFRYAAFDDIVTFCDAAFESSLIFEPSKAENITSLDFKGAVFEKQFSISGYYKCIPDFRQTKTSHHVDLSKLGVHLKRTKEEHGALREKTFDPDDAERLCRLKEIAESNKNQKRALAFHADEQRASRWGELNFWQSILDSFYSLTSDYGQSVLRPFVFLLMSIFVFSHITLSYADSKQDTQFQTALVISVATVTPFMAISKDARNNSIKKIFSNDIPESYYIYGYLHSFFSFIFIFLIGLGLRNRFRI